MMKFANFLGCCSVHEGDLLERNQAKAQMILARAQRRACKLALIADSLHGTSDQTEGPKARCTGRLVSSTVEKFHQLSGAEQQEWINFHQQLSEVASRVAQYMEEQVYILQILKHGSIGVLSSLSTMTSVQCTESEIADLKGIIGSYSESVVKDGKIGTRYMKILCRSHQQDLLDEWTRQVNADVNASDGNWSVCDAFLDMANKVVETLISRVVAPESPIDVRGFRHDMLALRAKRSLLKNHTRSAHNQITQISRLQEKMTWSDSHSKIKELELQRHLCEHAVTFYGRCSTVIELLEDKICESCAEGMGKK